MFERHHYATLDMSTCSFHEQPYHFEGPLELVILNVIGLIHMFSYGMTNVATHG